MSSPEPEQRPTRGSDSAIESSHPQGLFLHWDGRRGYRTRIPAPRVLEPVPELALGTDSANRVIEGDNLQIMVSLRSQYRSKFDVAYLDPPYNTGRNDFRYSDKRFKDPNADSDDAIYVNSEDGGKHTKWLNFMGPRLSLTWELLADHGVCFISIGDTELFRLGMLMDEVFGEKNRLGVIVWQGNVDNNPTRIATGHEYILCYAKRSDLVPSTWQGTSEAKNWMLTKFDELRGQHRDLEDLERAWNMAIQNQIKLHAEYVEHGGEPVIDLGPTLPKYKFVDKNGPFASNRDVHGSDKGQYFYDVIHPLTGRVCKRPPSGYRFPEETMRQLQNGDRIRYGKTEKHQVQIKKYLREVSLPLRGLLEINSARGSNTLKSLFPEGSQKFIHPKPVELIQQLLSFAGGSDALVLDPFAGSGTTAHAVLRLNKEDAGGRRFVVIEEGTPEDPYCRTLTAERIRRASKAESLPGGFRFETAGERVDRDVILQLEREAITNLIIQTDVTGMGRGLSRVQDSPYIIARNARREAIALCWNGRDSSVVTKAVLRDVFHEVHRLGLNKPVRVYGTTCPVGETDSFRFCQLPDEIVAALQRAEEHDDSEFGVLEALETTLYTSGGGQ